MRFCITDVHFGARLNKKIEELHEQFRQHEMLIIPSEEVLDEFIGEIKKCVDDLNAKYPRTKVIHVSHCNIGASSLSSVKHIWISQKESDTSLLGFNIKKIRGTYEGKGLAPERKHHE